MKQHTLCGGILTRHSWSPLPLPTPLAVAGSGSLLRRYNSKPLYHGLSQNEIVFGQKKCWWNRPLNNPRPGKDASVFMDEIHRAENIVSKLIDKHQADWLWVQNQGRKDPHNVEVDDQV